AFTRLHAKLGEGPGQTAAARPGLGVGQAHVATDHGHTVGKQLVGTAERINKGVHGASSQEMLCVCCALWSLAGNHYKIATRAYTGGGRVWSRMSSNFSRRCLPGWPYAAWTTTR